MKIKCWCVIDTRLMQSITCAESDPVYDDVGYLNFSDLAGDALEFYFVKELAEAAMYEQQQAKPHCEFILFEGIAYAQQGQANKDAWYYTETEEI